jgi:hypothetical protein
MNIGKEVILLGMSALLVLSGCSVKEDRSHCPCRLNLNFAEVDTLKISAVRVYVSESGKLMDDFSMNAEEFYPSCSLDVKRSVFDLNISAGDRGLWHATSGLRIPYGEDCPPLYLHSSMIDTRREVVDESVLLRKNHCVMTMVLETMDCQNCQLRVIGNVNGYDMHGKPSAGPFEYVPVVRDGVGFVVLPRQIDSSLMLEVDDGTDILKRFALGEYMTAGGYDWAAADLSDVTVNVNWTVTEAIIRLEGWDWVYEYEIVI